jgi:hypothetical protein
MVADEVNLILVVVQNCKKGFLRVLHVIGEEGGELRRSVRLWLIN